MFTTIRQYRGDAATMGQVAHAVEEHFADELTALPGFIAYEVIDCGGGDLFTTTTCADRETAERSSAMASDFVQKHLSGVGLNRTASHTGEVLVHRAMREAMEPVHA
jgi:hypothetical protein